MKRAAINLPEMNSAQFEINLKNCQIYSTTMYCDDKIKYTIYVAATNLQFANTLFQTDYHLNEIQKQYNEICHYPLTFLCENFFHLDTSEMEAFYNNDRSFVLVFEGGPI